MSEAQQAHRQLPPNNYVTLMEGADRNPRVAGLHFDDSRHPVAPMFAGQGISIRWHERIMPGHVITAAILRINFYQRVLDGKFSHPKNAEAARHCTNALELLQDTNALTIGDIESEMSGGKELMAVGDTHHVFAQWRNHLDTDDNPRGGEIGIAYCEKGDPKMPKPEVEIHWQAGPTKTDAQSGAFIEDVLQAAVIRLTQSSPMEVYNDTEPDAVARCFKAASECLLAIAALQERRAEREAAGTWGTNEV